MRTLGKLGLVVVLLIITCAAVLMIVNYREVNALESYMTELEESGAAMELSDLRSWRPEGTEFYSGPPEESAAAILVSEELNGLYDLLDSLGSLRYLWMREAHKQPPEDYERICVLLEEQESWVRRLKEIAGMPPTSMTDSVEVTRMGRLMFGARVPDLLACRATAELLLLDAYVSIREGSPDDGLRTCEDILRLVEHIFDIPGTVASMTAGSVGTLFAASLSGLTRGVEFSDGAIASLTAALEQASPRRALTTAYEWKFLTTKEYFAVMGPKMMEAGPADMIRAELASDMIRAELGMDGSLEGPPSALLSTGPVWAFNAAHDEHVATKLFQKAIKASPPRHYEAVDAWRALEEERAANRSWRTPVTSTFFGENMVRRGESFAISKAQLDLAIVFLALYRFERDSGVYPETLDVLVPDYLGNVLVDEFSGEPVRYRREEETFVLYSVGPDLQDDLGVRNKPRPDGSAGGDIVWGTF